MTANSVRPTLQGIVVRFNADRVVTVQSLLPPVQLVAVLVPPYDHPAQPVENALQKVFYSRRCVVRLPGTLAPDMQNLVEVPLNRPSL